MSMAISHYPPTPSPTTPTTPNSHHPQSRRGAGSVAATLHEVHLAAAAAAAAAAAHLAGLVVLLGRAGKNGWFFTGRNGRFRMLEVELVLVCLIFLSTKLKFHGLWWFIVTFPLKIATLRYPTSSETSKTMVTWLCFTITETVHGELSRWQSWTPLPISFIILYDPSA